MRRSGTVLPVFMMLVLSASLAGASAIAPFGNPSISPLGIDWQPTIEAQSITLRVAGPGDLVLERQFGAGEPVFLGIEDLPDGQYAWELTATPVLSAMTHQALESARQQGDDEMASRLRHAGQLPQAPMTQSGYFRIYQGSALSLQDEEAPLRPVSDESTLTSVTAADQVILDDLIVDGSACIGQDCVNGENFGFDTLRLKENNLRIKFQDTSTGTFPSNDWQLTANDSTNGGANRFSIDDIDGGRTPFTIEASAPSNSLYVDDGGRVGFGTSTPVVNLHAVSGNTPTLRLEQNGSSGFTAQTWDVAGNEANFFVRDVTNGSKLPFRIEPSTPQDAVYLDSTGNVGLGTNAPSEALHVRRTSGSANLRLQATAGSANISVEAGSGNADLTFDGAASTNVNVDRGNSSSQGRLALKTAGTLNWSVGLIPGSTGFHVGPGTASTFLYVDSAGPVGIGTTTPNASAALDVNGAIFQRGGQIHADYVFAPGYDLESIEDHARFMWENQHLPAMPKAAVDEHGREIVEIGSHRRGIVEELEKAHIYIEELNRRIAELEAAVQSMAPAQP